MNYFRSKLIVTGTGLAAAGLAALIPTVVHAACSPVYTDFSANPMTVTTSRPNTNFRVLFGNIQSCTQAELNELTFYIEPGTAVIGRFHETVLGSFITAGQQSSDIPGLSLNVVQPNPDYAPFTQRTVPYVAHIVRGQTKITTAAPVVITISDNRAGLPSTNTNTGNTNAPSPNSNTTPRPNTNTGISNTPNYDSSLGEFGNPLTLGSVPEIIARVIRILLALVGMVSIVVIILAGFRMVTQGDNPAQVTKARKAITWAILGLLAALLSFSIVSIVQRIIAR